MIRKFNEWFVVHVWIRAWVALHNLAMWLNLPESATDYCTGRIDYALEVYEPEKGPSDD